MKRTFLIPMLLSLFIVSAQANTSLSIGTYGIVPCCGGPCWDDTVIPGLGSSSNNFTLTGVSGTGIVQSSAFTVANTSGPGSHVLYTYSVDMTGMTAANHCITVLIHFGTPFGCSGDVLVHTVGAGVAVTSASKAPFGDITFKFGTGCLTTGQATYAFQLLTDQAPKTGYLTIIDDYINPGNNTTNETRVNVTAIVPDIPPNWAFALPPFYFPYIQGLLDTNIVGTNQFNTNPVPLSGSYDFTWQLVDQVSNFYTVGPLSTSTVQVVNGLFNLPLPGDPSSFTGGTRYVNLGVRPSNLPAVQFTPLNPPLSVAPTPQALYAFSAGVVADISSNQAVLSLNGLTGNAVLAGANGIQVTLNGDGKTITIGGSGSDRNIKTDFGPVQPEDILNKLLTVPIQTWRYTNEVAGVRHLGPMAQDFMATFGLGNDNKMVGIVDEGGVALTAIQGLNQKLEDQLKEKDAEIQELKQRLEKLEQRMESPPGAANK